MVSLQDPSRTALPEGHEGQRYTHSSAPMMGAAAIGEWIYVAGGGPLQGGGFQSAYNEAFTLG